MKKIKYLTEKVGFCIRQDKTKEKINEILNARADEGWRLSKIAPCEGVGVIFIVFEKESDLLD